ncbi:tRNA methyltransferase 11 [Tritrichomonas musculus]|uniref:tRNA methyltransferase 11 n=1 Tax=Tritrichomonas musculus TaxID=1915356 RepID=A0ABR2KSW5_9EUKA
MPRYLVHAPLQNKTFIYSELLASARYLNIDLKFENPNLKIGEELNSPFFACVLPSDEDAISLAKRSPAIQSVSHLLADGINFDEFYQNCNKIASEHDINDGSFAVRVETCSKKLTNELRVQYIHELVENLHITSKVDLKNPDKTVILFLNYEERGDSAPLHIYAGVFMCNGNSKFVSNFPLNKRKFINTTSMEPSIALLSASQGLCGPGKITYDPFCGSGSLLVASASLGSHVIGSDYDLSSMYKNDNDWVGLNFDQYGLKGKFIDVFRCDVLTDVFRFNRCLDAIVTDPPYGIREKCVSKKKKSSKKSSENPNDDDAANEKEDANANNNDNDEPPSPLLPLLLRLYALAARGLRLGGRLVFWLPCAYNLDAEAELPKQKALKLISNSRQTLSARYCRHLITYEKIDDSEEAVNSKVEFNAMNASFLKLRDLVFQHFENTGKNRRERKKFAKQLKNKLSGIDQNDENN